MEPVGPPAIARDADAGEHFSVRFVSLSDNRQYTDRRSLARDLEDTYTTGKKTYR